MKFPRASILFTDDDADTRKLISLRLSKEGFDVVSTQDQSQTLKLARQKKFDSYLLDSWMPGLSGLELCSQLREFDSETPILFYSGAGFVQIRLGHSNAVQKATWSNPLSRTSS